jgi:hypothetical protein
LQIIEALLDLFEIKAKIIPASEGLAPHEAQESFTWFNANTVGPEFFSADAKLLREKHLATRGSPFLYSLINLTLENNVNQPNEKEDNNDNKTGSLVEFEEDTFQCGDKDARYKRRAHSVSVSNISGLSFLPFYGS